MITLFIEHGLEVGDQIRRHDGLAANASLYKHLPYDPIKDLAPVNTIARVSIVMGVAPGFQAKTVQEVIALARSSPGKLNYASCGPGTPHHIAGEMLNKVGVAVVTLPGGEVFQALQSGTIDAAEFVGPWNDFAFGFHQVAKNYYAPGVGEPSSTEEVVMNASAYNALPDDLKLIVKTVAMSAAVETTMDYEINNAKTVRLLTSEHGVTVRTVPQAIVDGLAAATGELVQDLHADSDPMVREVIGSYAKYRNLMAEYAPYGFAGEMNARTLPFAEG